MGGWPRVSGALVMILPWVKDVWRWSAGGDSSGWTLVLVARLCMCLRHQPQEWKGSLEIHLQVLQKVVKFPSSPPTPHRTANTEHRSHSNSVDSTLGNPFCQNHPQTDSAFWHRRELYFIGCWAHCALLRAWSGQADITSLWIVGVGEGLQWVGSL